VKERKREGRVRVDMCDLKFDGKWIKVQGKEREKEREERERERERKKE
jgi:hypothetical protein